MTVRFHADSHTPALQRPAISALSKSAHGTRCVRDLWQVSSPCHSLFCLASVFTLSFLVLSCQCLHPVIPCSVLPVSSPCHSLFCLASVFTLSFLVLSGQCLHLVIPCSVLPVSSPCHSLFCLASVFTVSLLVLSCQCLKMRVPDVDVETKSLYSSSAQPQPVTWPQLIKEVGDSFGKFAKM